MTKILVDSELLERVQAVLSRWSGIINYQYNGSQEAMSYLQIADDMSQPVLNEVSAALSAPQQEAVADCAKCGFASCSAGCSYYRSRISAIPHPAPSVPEGWIPCSEQKPVEYRTVLIGIDGIPYPITAFWTGEKWCKDVIGPEYYPTHWMPLPPAPNSAAPNPPSADDRKDAERYRSGIKNELLLLNTTHHSVGRKFREEYRLVHPANAKDWCDTVIDAAIAAQKGEKE